MGKEMRDLIRGTVRDHRLVRPGLFNYIDIARRLQLPLQSTNEYPHLPETSATLFRNTPSPQT